MKRLKTIYRIMFLSLLLLLNPLKTTNVVAGNQSTTPANQESQLSSDDWKIVIDEKKSSNEFGFIQKNLDTSNLADNGQFLFIAGITLLVLSDAGVIFFSFCLYKLLRKSTPKSATKCGGARYK